MAELVARNAPVIDQTAKVVVAAAARMLVWIAASEEYVTFAAWIVGSIAAYKLRMAKEASLVTQMTTMAD